MTPSDCIGSIDELGRPLAERQAARAAARENAAQLAAQRKPCPTCAGDRPQRRTGQVPSEALAPLAAWKTCPDCNGSGVAAGQEGES